MYGKFFASAFTGSMMGAGTEVFAVWAYIIANADRSGQVELNPRLLGAVLGCDHSTVRSALDYLQQPDPESRTTIADGRRLVPMHAFWYEVVNHQLYREMRNSEERREYNRKKQSDYRALKRVNTENVQCVPRCTEAEAELEVEAELKVVEVLTESINLKSSGNTNLARPKSSVEEVVNAIYGAYPRKVGSGKAKPAISTALKKLGSTMNGREAQVWLYRKVQAFARSPAGQAGALTPHPATWFNQARYHDDPAQWEIISGGTSGVFVNKSQQRANSNIEAAANYIAEIDGREAAADFVRGATGQSERYSLEDLRKPALEAPDRGRAGSGHQPVTIEASGG